MSNQLETPPFIWFNGEIRHWENAKIHIWTEVAIRGTNVFEGIKAYWEEENNCYKILSLNDHLKRLFESAKMLKFSNGFNYDEIKEGIFELLKKLNYKQDTYIRPTLYVEHGKYSESTNVGAYIVAFPSNKNLEDIKGLNCCVSSWRRADDLVISPRIKTGAAYSSFRLPKLEAVENGFDDAILLNNRNTVAEATGSAVIMIKNNILYTVPNYAGVLESITVKHISKIAEEVLKIKVVEKEILRSQLYTADEVFLCGTLNEIEPVLSIDGIKIDKGEIGILTKRIYSEYLKAMLEEQYSTNNVTKLKLEKG